MAMTPYPPDYTDKGDELVYGFINNQCDMIANHFDEGIPWQEALDNDSIPEDVVEKIKHRKNMNNGREVYLGLTPLIQSRVDIAAYWNPNVDKSIKDKWENMAFDDTLTSNAYFNFCCYMIDEFQPIYFNYGIESNSKSWTTTEFEKYLLFCSRVYPRLKQKYPDLPIFLSYMVSVDDTQLENAKLLNQYSDYVTISSYPYFETGSSNGGTTEPINIPKDWYTAYRNIDITKPFGIAETGYIAEDLILPEFGIEKQGDPVWQADAIQQMFEICNDLNAEFVVYWCPYDYDNGMNTLESIGMAIPSFKIWKDIGLYDGNGIKRPSLEVWKKWYKAKKVG